MFDAQTFQSLLRLSVTEPEKGAVAVIGINPPIGARWTLLALAVVLGTVLAYLPLILGGSGQAMLSPITATVLQGGMNVAAVALISAVGRMFGGQGSFEDALLLVGWLQVIMLVLQAIQLVVMLILPPLTGLVIILSIALFFWLLSGFICALHGFESRFRVLLGTFGTLFIAAFVFLLILQILGIELPGMRNA